MNMHSVYRSENGDRDDKQKENFKEFVEGNQLAYLAEWFNSIHPSLSLPLNSEEELRAFLLDGSVLCAILDRLSPGSIAMVGSSQPSLGNVERFLAAMDDMALPKFEISNLEKGSMVPVLKCLLSLRACFNLNSEGENIQDRTRKRWSLSNAERLDGTDKYLGDASTRGEENQRNSINFKLPNKEQEVLQLKQECHDDLSDAKILASMKIKNLDSVSTQLLLNIVDEIFEEYLEKKNGDVPNRVACLLRKVVQVIERRLATQAESLRSQSSIYKSREEKYQLKIRLLETLAAGTSDENQVVLNQLQLAKIQNTRLEEINKNEGQDVARLKKEKIQNEIEISTLKQELEMSKKTHENICSELEARSKETKTELEKKINELELLLTDSRSKVKELEAYSESKYQRWQKKERTYQRFLGLQCGALQELRVVSESIKHEVLKTKRGYSEEFYNLGMNLKGLADAAENYHLVLAENRKLYNEVQDLKGNIRVYCRIRPFLPGKKGKQTTIEYIGEDGELVVANPSKQGKDNRRLFKFNKVFGSTATQEEVFLDTQPLIRSVLDGYNVCIFAYGQTGSGKTYTMSGPNISSKEDWGVNYRALNDLFQISQNRRSSILYEIGVQMVEIYNEQVRDLLSNDISQKRLGIWNTTQPNGLAVPNASMHPVNSTADVLELMHVGLMNRAVGATALNERSSRSHSILTVHVRGVDLKTDAVLRGSLHLVDLAGSERVDRSEATGDRLKEAQHINKSLSALGDVIFALAQKNLHVPYRNSKLTQVLQSSLGGQAKTLMFVQLNPDVESYSETISTLKFAERVSGVELGAARSNKEGRDVKELMEQVSTLKEAISKKDEKIERLQQPKANANGEKRGISSLKYGPSSPVRHSIGSLRPSRTMSAGRVSGYLEKAASDMDNCSEQSDRPSEAGSQQSVDDYRNRQIFLQSKLSSGDVGRNCTAGQNIAEDDELLGFGNGDSEERLSDISDGVLSMATETESVSSGVVELTMFPEVNKPVDNTDKSSGSSTAPPSLRPSTSAPPNVLSSDPSKMPSKLPKFQAKPLHSKSRSSLAKSSSNVPSSMVGHDELYLTRELMFDSWGATYLRAGPAGHEKSSLGQRVSDEDIVKFNEVRKESIVEYWQIWKVLFMLFVPTLVLHLFSVDLTGDSLGNIM